MLEVHECLGWRGGGAGENKMNAFLRDESFLSQRTIQAKVESAWQIIYSFSLSDSQHQEA